MKHVISAQHFDRSELLALLQKAQTMLQVKEMGGADTLRGKIMAALFFEPSTRTRLSFESAMMRLGGNVISTENAREFSSAIKGETLEDTIRVVSGYADVIVLRHHEIGAGARAAHVSSVPVLSAGDGAGEHPTQALLDLFTIHQEIGRVEDLTVTLIGDLLYGRTVHSLVYILSQFKGIRLICTAPAATSLPSDVLAYATARGVVVEQEPDLARALQSADVVYQTRVQKERFASSEEYEKNKAAYVIDQTAMTYLPPHAILMHPLPRAGEIAPVVDADPRAAYFRQSHYGVPVRMALLLRAFGQ
ncbi:MAG: aspartate carbamoyltransferase [Firmicutes bacterium]|nr:aspartate carbamoyltransferase [Bacillota bacterium]